MAAFGGGSLVSNILQKSSVLDERVIDQSVQKLTKKSNQLKGEIYEILKQNYVEFQSYVDSTASLEQKLQEVTAEYRRLSGRIEHEVKGRILRSADKRKEIEAKLQGTQKKIDFVQGLVSVYQCLEASKVDLQSEKYSSAAAHLNDTAEQLEKVGRSGCDAKVFRALKSELALVISGLSLKLQEEWSRFVVWNPKVIPENITPAALLSVELRVPARSGSLAVCFDEVVTAMRSLTTLGIWSQKIGSFGKRLLKLVVVPLILNPGLKTSRTQEKGVAVLRFMKTEGVDLYAHIQVVYGGLGAVFTLVREVVPTAYREEWMRRLGEVVSPEMSELIIKHCLAATVPKSPVELEKYGEIGTQTAEFEESLLKLGVVESDFKQLSEYTGNVNTHFAAQKCQDLLVKARSILMKPIHNAVSTTNDEVLSRFVVVPPPTVAARTRSKAKKSPAPSAEVDLNALTFAFPQCTISESVKEFVELLYSTLEECCNTTANPSTAVQLFYATRNMVELFRAVLPSFHRSTIAELPRIAVVQHNNCMFLAHHLITLGHQFHSRLPPPLDSEVATFIDQVPYVRQLGEECFLAEMKKQCNSILQCLKSFGGFDDVSSDDKCELVYKGVRQALLQVTKLGKVYAEVLPVDIHHKAVGSLLNTLVANVIDGILALEDIAADDATELHSLVNVILEKGPSALFGGASEAESVSTYCGSWLKLGKLATVLNAGLQEIVGLWDTGSGPLAQAFTPVELRGLIKALFQNTDRRASAVAKITL